jgi:hypothetical protein
MQTQTQTQRHHSKGKIMFARVSSVGLTLTLLCSGCMAEQAGHLYDMKTGRQSTLHVDSAVSSNGAVKTTLPDGAACEGQFSEISKENAERITKVPPMLTENSQASVAVMNCGPGRVLTCTLARRPMQQFSYGECQDQQGSEYSLIF